jgi:hypothetical protein
MTVSEVETQMPEMPNVQDLIQNAYDQDYNKANKVFGNMMTVKLDDLLNQEKIKLADQIFNGASDVEDDEDNVGDEDGAEQLEFDLEAEGELESDDAGYEESDEVEEDEDDLTDEEIDDMLDNMSDEEVDELLSEIEDEE